MTRTAFVAANRQGTGGRTSVRPSLRWAAGLVTLVVLAPASGVTAAGVPAAPVTVRELDGAYQVTATFTTPEPAAVARQVLTDYEGIPRFMPDVRSSRVVERSATGVVVEQEAVARVLFFSKQITLRLDIQEHADALCFRDRSGKSFIRYEGRWILREQDGHAVVTYELTAKPAFDVPGWVLTRLLKRDAERLIERLQAEIHARARAALPLTRVTDRS